LPPASLKDRRNMKARNEEDGDNEINSKLELLEQERSNLNSKSGVSDAQKKARKQALLKGK
jgi:hypothetical protein